MSEFLGRTGIAAMALQGLLASGGAQRWDYGEAATMAVRCADELLAELRKPSAAVPHAVEIADAVLECVELLARTPAFHDTVSCAKTIDAVTAKLAAVADQARIVRGRR